MHYLLISPDGQTEEGLLWQIIEQEGNAIASSSAFTLKARIIANGYKDGMWFQCESSIVPGLIERDKSYQLSDMEKFVRMLSKGESALTDRQIQSLKLLRKNEWTAMSTWYKRQSDPDFDPYIVDEWRRDVADRLQQEGMVQYQEIKLARHVIITDKGLAYLERVSREG